MKTSSKAILLNTAIKCGVITLSIVGLSGCAFTLLDWVTPDEGYEQQVGIAYGQHPRQQLDIYNPNQANNKNMTVLFFYGGAWQGGNKQDYRFVAQALSEKGYQVVIPNYRVYPEALFPDFMDDAANALHWVSRNIEQPIVLMGHSAGAHIAALLALDEQYTTGFNTDPSRIAGLIGLSGPYDFLPLKSKRLKTIFNAAQDIQHTQPINYVSSSAPPTLLIYGEDDTTVLPFNSKNLADKLAANGVNVTTHFYPDAGHGVTVGALSIPFRNQLPVLDVIDRFLSHL